jgi:hypothetical protein
VSDEEIDERTRDKIRTLGCVDEAADGVAPPVETRKTIYGKDYEVCAYGEEED